jgi:stage V sporulation protein B
MILLAAGIINRILGFVPRITLPRIIGAEGVGLFQMGYPFLFAVLTLITSGFQLAVSKLVAEADSAGDEAKVRRVLMIALSVVIGLGLLFMAGGIAGADWIIARLLTDSRVYYTFLWMSPVIPVAGISSVLRGYYYGRQNMIPTALSQVTETVLRMVMMLILAYLLLPRGIEIAAAGAMAGVLAGEIGGLVLLALYHRGGSRGQADGRPKTPHSGPTGWSTDLRQMFRIAVPVTGSKLVGSLSSLFEPILISQCLALAGVATALATAQYGALQGMVIPVLYLPSALTFSLAVSLVPSLSEAAARKDYKTIYKRLHQSLRLTLVTGAPFVVLMFVLADPLCLVMYGQSGIGPMLKMMAPIALFIYFQAPLNATLQALDRPGTALVNTTIGSLLKLGLIYGLASRPEWGIKGAILAINAYVVLVTLLHWRSVVKLLDFRLPSNDFWKVGSSMIIMGAVCYLVMYNSWGTGTAVKFLLSSLTGLLVYLLCIFAFQLVDVHDLKRIPWPGRRPR